MSDHLSKNQKRALRALLVERTVRDAAKAAGVSTRTVYNYLSQSNFLSALRARQDELTAATVASLAGGAGLALATLEEVMDSDATAAAKVRAALGWLKAWRDAVELDSLEKRVSELEASNEHREAN